jgi:hypothetical protein
MGLLANIFSTADTAKRRLSGLLADPMGTLALGVTRFGEDQGGLLNMTQNAYPMAGNKTVLNSPQQIANFRQQVADKGAEMAMQAATVWHGSPHKFDKFDSSKIGTGEGAQAYGHGLYLAESPDVANAYKAAQRDQSSGAIADKYLKNWGSKDKAISALEQRLPKVREEFKPEFVSQYEEALSMLKRGESGGGSLYKVDLPDEHIAKMLDWDKPLSQQHPDIQALASKYDYPKNRTGGDFQRWLSSPSGGLSVNLRGPKDQSGLEKQAADLFRQHGIPGIRYLDGGSRGAGAGTSNFVIFPQNEGLLKILERNGQALK